jgi:predicted ArsR family transcriptional regulator
VSVPPPVSAAQRSVLYAVRRRGQATVTDIAESLDMTLSGARQHLTGLAEAGLLEVGEAVRTPGQQGRTERIAAARARLAAAGGFEAKVVELAKILDEDGYLASVEPLGDGGYRVAERNCAIFAVAREHPQACSTELEFLRAALPEATIERVSHMMAGAHSCSYEVRPR